MGDDKTIVDWLKAVSLEQYAVAFIKNDIDLDVLADLTAQDLREIGVTSVGHRRRLLSAIAALQTSEDTAEPKDDPADGTGPERRLLSVLFCDLVDSTALASACDPEDYVDFIATFQRTIETAIKAYGGHVSKFLGDGVMATFGYPTASDHDAERAVAAGLEALSRISQLSGPNGWRASARVGIATGLTVVGGVEPGAGDDSAIGDTPNRAARLQSIAEPDTLVIAERTRALIGGVFTTVARGQHMLKGYSAPIAVFEVTGRNRAAARFEALRHAPQDIFVGRQAELAQLRGLIRDRARPITVVEGESGMGKSWLVRQALAELSGPTSEAKSGAVILQASPYGAGVPFDPVRGLLETVCHIQAGDDPMRLRDKITGFLSTRHEATERSVALLSQLLAPEETLTGHLAGSSWVEVRARMMRLLERVLIAMATPSRHIVLEDAQWLDPSSAELLEKAQPGLARAGIRLIATATPGPRPDWLAAPQANLLPLNRLDQTETLALLAAQANTGGLSHEALAKIVARSDGVPAFATELARGAAGGGEDVPLSLSESLQAQLDRLTQGRRVACQAAAVGREMPVAVLLAVVEMPESAARRAIDELISAEILMAGSGPYGPTVRFRHALVKEAAYDLLLRRQRPAHHARIAGVLAARFPAIAEAQPHIMAIQHSAARHPERSATEWLRAGRRAFGRSAYAEAVGFYRSALGEIQEVAAGNLRDKDELEIRLSLMSGLICVSGYQSEEVSAQSDRVIALSRSLGETALLLPALQARWVHLASGNSFREATGLARQALHVTSVSTEADRLIAIRMCATSLLFEGALDEAEQHYTRFLAQFDPEAHGEAMRAGHSDHATMILLGMAELSTLRGDLPQAAHWRDRMFAFARASERVHDIGHTLAFSALHTELEGAHSQTLRLTGELDALMEQHALPNWWGFRALLSGVSRVRAGDSSEGLAEARSGIDRLVEVKAFGNWWYLTYAEACLMAGASRELGWALRRASRIADAGDVRLSAEILRLRACLLTAQGHDTPTAAPLLKRGLALAQQQGAGLLARRIEATMAELNLSRPRTHHD